MPGRIISFLLILLVLAGCRLETPQEPQRSEIWMTSRGLVLSGDLKWCSWGEPVWPQGHWTWLWRDAAGESVSGTTFLRIAKGPRARQARWIFRPAPPAGRLIELLPVNHQQWHSFNWQVGREPPVPLPRQPVASIHFEDLLGLLKTLTLPHFDRIVTHWPAWPVPVRSGQAVSGEVDLSGCLREAMAIWNEGLPQPLFQNVETADWGIRLVYFPGIQLQPPLQARITRLRPDGAPQVIQILVGGNFDQPWDRIYAVRGMVHELGHALFLWGHSPDREHCLWESGPPQVAVPSADEKEAVRWWHGLPEGIDLGNYQRLSAPGRSRASWRPGGHPGGRPLPGFHPASTGSAARR